MRSNPLNSVLLLLVVVLLSEPGCAKKKPAGPADSPRTSSQPPAADIKRAVEAYKALDPDASFTFANGQVDSFATTAKSQVPDYAMATLATLGLPTAARPITKLPSPVQGPVQTSDLDTTDQTLPFVNETQQSATAGTGQSDAADPPSKGQPTLKIEARAQPAPNPDQMPVWDRPDQRTRALEARAAGPILVAFLERNARLFNADQGALQRSLSTAVYRPSAHLRHLAFDQYIGGEKLLYGRTVIQFDTNWNVVGISRMLATPEKIKLKKETATARASITNELATRTAMGVPPDQTCKGREIKTPRAELALDMVRELRVWDVELASRDGECHWRTIVDAKTGRVLNVSDLVDRAHTDARVNRWQFPSGDLFAPGQIVSTGQYTRDDRRLEHDFFYMMNDHRCEGAAETSCSATGFTTNWCEKAYGSTSGSSFVRATRRSDRDFSNYFPGGASETFAETNSYYWARQFAQWLKPSLDSMGVLPDSASDFPRVLIVTDTCRSGSVHNASLDVTTEDDKGEGTNVIRLAHRNPAGSANHNAACEGGGCFDNPSNLHHEMNHFFLRRYYDFGSDLDCGAGNQMRFTHEGTLGTAVPQAFWQRYYNVGYNPSDTDRLYFSNSTIGRVHSNASTRMTVDGFLCVNNTDDAYSAGRVVGQALWEFYHGVNVSGSSSTPTWRPSTDTDYNVLVYWAADLQGASTYKDRYEYANRFMEILDKHSNWSSQAKREYCAVFEHHGLRDFINDDYCS